MSFMPYVAPEQLMKDRSDYAHKGIARGRSVMGLEYADGLLFLAENPSATLHKISEVYDKIAFAGVGKYSEFEELRIAGIRLADLRGYQYGREDVKARDLANAYSQALSTIFTQQMKPYEIELLVGEVDGDANGTIDAADDAWRWPWRCRLRLVVLSLPRRGHRRRRGDPAGGAAPGLGRHLGDEALRHRAPAPGRARDRGPNAAGVPRRGMRMPGTSLPG